MLKFTQNKDWEIIECSVYYDHLISIVILKGILYIKDGDKSKFITIFSITPATNISDILILREGNEWQSTNTVYLRQIIDLKLVGEGMHKARYSFDIELSFPLYVGGGYFIEDQKFFFLIGPGIRLSF